MNLQKGQDQMSKAVYLLRNGDLYNIGVSKNIERTKQSLRPGSILSVLYTDKDKITLEALQNRYSQKRLHIKKINMRKIILLMRNTLF